jgi:hypothetical protein
MKKRSFGKLQLNRETLRNLDTGELSLVAGGLTSYGDDCTAACYGNSNASGCPAACQQTATCDCNADWGTVYTYSGLCNGSYGC